MTKLAGDGRESIQSGRRARRRLRDRPAESNDGETGHTSGFGRPLVAVEAKPPGATMGNDRAVRLAGQRPPC